MNSSVAGERPGRDLMRGGVSMCLTTSRGTRTAAEHRDSSLQVRAEQQEEPWMKIRVCLRLADPVDGEERLQERCCRVVPIRQQLDPSRSLHALHLDRCWLPRHPSRCRKGRERCQDILVYAYLASAVLMSANDSLTASERDIDALSVERARIYLRARARHRGTPARCLRPRRMILDRDFASLCWHSYWS